MPLQPSDEQELKRRTRKILWVLASGIVEIIAALLLIWFSIPQSNSAKQLVAFFFICGVGVSLVSISALCALKLQVWIHKKSIKYAQQHPDSATAKLFEKKQNNS